MKPSYKQAWGHVQYHSRYFEMAMRRDGPSLNYSVYIGCEFGWSFCRSNCSSSRQQSFATDELELEIFSSALASKAVWPIAQVRTLYLLAAVSLAMSRIAESRLMKVTLHRGRMQCLLRGNSSIEETAPIQYERL